MLKLWMVSSPPAHPPLLHSPGCRSADFYPFSFFKFFFPIRFGGWLVNVCWSDVDLFNLFNLLNSPGSMLANAHSQESLFEELLNPRSADLGFGDPLVGMLVNAAGWWMVSPLLASPETIWAAGRPTPDQRHEGCQPRSNGHTRILTAQPPIIKLSQR